MATVTDTAAGTASTPTGTLGFESDGAGSFDPNTNQCTLTQTSPGVASCLVTYTPHTSNTPTPTRTDTITATYGGDTTHAGSSGTGAVAVRPASRADCQQGGWQNYGFSSQRQCLQCLGGGLGQQPTSKADCQHGRWRTLGFRNQGQCIQSLSGGQRTRGKSKQRQTPVPTSEPERRQPHRRRPRRAAPRRPWRRPATRTARADRAA